MAMEYLPEGAAIRQLRVEYKQQAVFGDMFYPLTAAAGNCVSVLFASRPGNEDNHPYAVLEYTLA